jgi:3-(3-hydroxy-phenyl)propionate hydroxylase/6-hydroxy-3-succinoylpyridine 3-monooxygenase
VTHIVVVGAGPVGLVAALGLARSGFAVTVLERGTAPVDAPRAASYHYPVLDVFESVGILEDVEAAGVRIGLNRMLMLRTGELLITDQGKLAGRVPHPYNVNLGQDALSAIVLEHLADYPDVVVRWGAEVRGIEQDGHTASAILADGARVTGDWLLGADGARSAVREALGLGFDGFTWDDKFVATNVRFPFERYGFEGANMVLDAELGCIVAQLTKDGLWRVTFAEDDGLPDAELPERIAAFFATFLPLATGDPEQHAVELVAYSPYKMHQRAADTFRVGRVLLAGDAAHVTNPTGALGLTSGLLDLEILLPALQAVAAGEAPESVLDDYAQTRRTKFLEHTSPFASDFKRLVYGRNAEALEGAFAAWKAAVATEDSEIEFLLGIGAIRSESVIPATT